MALERSEEMVFEDRICSAIPLLALKPLSDDEFFNVIPLPHIPNSEIKRPNLANIKNHLLKEGLLSDFQAFYLCECVLSLFKAEPNILDLPVPINICGDIHGQFYDLVQIFSDDLGGVLEAIPSNQVEGSSEFSEQDKFPIEKNRFLFLGDYVDRGLFSIECLFYLFALKIVYPDQIFLLRGNHESEHMTKYFTFENECSRKYSSLLYNKILEIFNALPLCAVVNRQLFCVHGGISPDLKSLKDIEKLNRFHEPPSRGLYCDLLWSDPSSTYDYDSPDGERFTLNRVRGCSYSYHFGAVVEFLNKHNLLCIVRAHEAQAAGYRMYKTNPKSMFPSVITLFSAPNYVDVYNNKAAIMKYDGTTMDIRQFAHNPHPYHLPNMMDAFSWSIPFVAQKISDIFLIILSNATDMDTISAIYDSNDSNEIEVTSTENSASGQVEISPTPTKPLGILLLNIIVDDLILKKSPIVQKIRAVSKLIRSYNILRTQRESIIELKALMRTDRLPYGTLALGAEGIRQAISSFDVARRSDIENEHMPPDDQNCSSMRQILTPSEIEKEANHANNSGEVSERKRASVQITEAVILSASPESGDIAKTSTLFIPPVIIDSASYGVSEDPEKFIYASQKRPKNAPKGGTCFNLCNFLCCGPT